MENMIMNIYEEMLVRIKNVGEKKKGLWNYSVMSWWDMGWVDGIVLFLVAF